MTELPGVGEWLLETVPDADILYVKMPKMKNTDEPVKEELPAFEERLADAFAQSILKRETRQADVSRISWQGIGQKVMDKL